MRRRDHHIREQPSLFGFDDQPEPPAQRHSETSQAAAEQIKPSRNRLRQRVHRFLESRGCRGATDEEIQLALEMNPSTQRPRRIELVEQGAVVASGVKRPTRTGRMAQVWVVAGHSETVTDGHSISGVGRVASRRPAPEQEQ